MQDSLGQPGGLVLPISRQARTRLDLEGEAFPESHASPEDFLLAARRFAELANSSEEMAHGSHEGVSAGRLHALVLVSRFLRLLLDQYRDQRQPDVLSQAVRWLEGRFGSQRLQNTWKALEHLFPSNEELARPSGVSEEGRPAGNPDPEDRLEALLLIWALNDNSAAGSWQRLFDDQELEAATGYREMLDSLGEFFDQQPGFGPDDENFLTLFRAPARVAADSLSGQLRFIARVSGEIEDPSWPRQVLVGLDVMREEEKPVFVGPGGAPGPGPPEVLEFSGMDQEEERFSRDRRWMPELVMMAKNVFVWLDQLSKSYGRPLQRLDQIPDRELDRLARWGMSGLWLIGLWQRSQASQQIKKLCGNPEAAASAYSLDDYQIAEELGGEAALEDLTRRASRRGIRLACDMVPNHFGLDSKWVLEHPDRFLSLPRPPFPGYRFEGPDLSPHPEIGLYLEDGYYSRQDAAVVFLRRERSTGKETFVYHGNDGTGLPWNDTAQLDYLSPETREAVIEAIVGVAKRFPIIRFDAAMTLARRHVQRLWYPEPGKGGDIPSRAEFGMSAAEFRRSMPIEFWREVVDRVALEAPDTLLLAEAFWLMEGYFVRTLGMHRVYHSAFMHMLRDEDNAGFRETLRNTLEFNPAILQRFVNYLTNPDEASAASQFGTGEKYFGACVLMVTLPGLPLFGHGQVEGLAEKYGMEYRRAYSQEQPLGALVERHEQQVAPLLERRRLFAGAEHFRLFDFEVSSGSVDPNVLAFTNGVDSPEGDLERVLVVFHNRAGSTRGQLRMSVPWRSTGGEDAVETTEPNDLRQESLAEALGWDPQGGEVIRFRDLTTGLEYLVDFEAGREVALDLHLGPYECRVLGEFEVMSSGALESARSLADFLDNEGVPNLQEALEELHRLPARDLVGEFLDPAWLEALEVLYAEDRVAKGRLLERFEEHAIRCLTGLEPWIDGEPLSRGEDEQGSPVNSPVSARAVSLAKELKEVLGRLGDLRELDQGAKRERDLGSWFADGLGLPSVPGEGLGEAVEPIPESQNFRPRQLGFLVWLCLRDLGALKGTPDVPARSRALLDAWSLGRQTERALRRLGIPAEGAARSVAAIKLFTGKPRDWWMERRTVEAVVKSWFRDPEIARFLDVHTYDGVRWFHREAFEELRWWAGATAWASGSRVAAVAGKELLSALEGVGEQVEYRVDELLKIMESGSEQVTTLVPNG